MDLSILAPVGAVSGSAVRVFLSRRVMKADEGTDLMKKIAQATNAKIDPKTGTLTLDSDQYMIALAIANGAKIDDKTGYLKVTIPMR